MHSSIYARTSPAQPRSEDDLLTIAETAHTLHVSTRTVRRYLSQGLLACTRLSARAVRVRRSALQRFIDGATTASQVGAPEVRHDFINDQINGRGA